MEPFTRPNDHLLVECLDCCCQTHLRFAFMQELVGQGRHACGACRWRKWAAKSRRLQSLGSEPVGDLSVNVDAVRILAETNGFEYLGPLTEPSLQGDPHRVRCLTCQRFTAERPGDIEWGCSCRVNRKREKPTHTAGARKPVSLFKDSNRPGVQWWAHDLNAETHWHTATVNATRVVWWRCPTCGHEFEDKVREFGNWAPRCERCERREDAERQRQREKWVLTKVADVPELMTMWNDSSADPRMVPVYSGRQEFYVFRCSAGHRRHREPDVVLTSRCPSCSAIETSRANDDLRLAGVEDHTLDVAAFALDPEIKAQWHPSLNGSLKPEKVGPRSRRVIWWRDHVCGHEWAQSPSERDKRYRLLCPQCNTRLGSLAAFYPELAEQWDPGNPVTPWHVLPTQKLDFVPTWICAQNPEHRWQATNAARVNGSECPQCITKGKSRVELAIFEAIRELDPTAESGTPVHSTRFVRRRSWRPDVLALSGTAAFEYDGSYWHADKAKTDVEKSRDLLAAGLAVYRLREMPLRTLGIEDSQYKEAFEYHQIVDVEQIAEDFLAWARHLSVGGSEPRGS